MIKFCVEHPVTIWMLVILLMLLGGLSLFFMDVELLPNISVPTLVVVTKMIKASPQEIEEKITKPLEEVLNSVSDLKSISSRSKEGVSQIKLEFEWGKDIDLAVIEVKEKIYKVKLPKEADKPYIWKWDPSSEPILRFDIYDERGTLSLSQLKELAEKKIKPKLERIKGVGSVTILGGREKEFKILVSRKKLQAKYLTILQVISAIQKENLNLKAGKIEESKYEYLVRVIGKSKTQKELENIVIATRKHEKYDKIAQIYLKDVAKVKLDYKSTSNYARIDGTVSIGFSIKKTSGGNVVKVISSIKEELKRLKKEKIIPSSIKIIISRDDSEYILQSQNIVISNIFQGCILAGFLIIFFIRDIKVAILLGISIPFSIIAAFSFLYGYGLSRNILTLGGMALAAGMVLDGSIVILENIYKHIEMGKEVKRASIEGTLEVSMGIITSSLTTILVFLPLLFTKGIIREIFKDLTLAIIAAIIFSTIIGLMFMPMMGSRILKPKKKLSEMFFFKRIVLKSLYKFDEILEKILEMLLNFILSYRFLRIFIFIVLIILSFISIFYIPSKDFIPKGKVREIQIDIEPFSGASLEFIDKKAKEIEKILQNFKFEFKHKIAKIEKITTSVNRDKATIFIKLKFLAKKGEKEYFRKKSILKKILNFISFKRDNGIPYTKKDILEVVSYLREKLEKYSSLDSKIYVTILEKVNPQGAIPLKVSIVAKNPKKWTVKKIRNYLRYKVLPYLKHIKGAIYFRLSKADPLPELEIYLNKRAITDLGGDTTQISQSIRCFITGFVASTININGEDIDIRVIGEKEERKNINEIKRLPILTKRGTYIKIKDVSEIIKTLKESQIDRKDKKTTVVLQANQIPYLISNRTLGDIIDTLNNLFNDPNFPPSAPKGEKFKDIFLYSFEGQSKDLIESSKSALWSLILSIILIYMVMCCQFESLFEPLIIMITVPLSFPGIALLLHLTKEEYSLSAMVGFICLGGVVVNNGIILIEFVNILKERGVELKEALIGASKRKLRSILITSFTSILGMLPIILGIGEGSELYRGCCSVILGGLLVSTPLTLIGLPVFYMIMEDIKELLSLYMLKISIFFSK